VGMVRYAITNGSLPSLPAKNLMAAQGGTDRAEFKPLAQQARELAALGVNFLLLRERALSAGELCALTRYVLAETTATGLQVLIPGRVDVALAVGAAGVHLSAAPGELRTADVRRLMPDAFVSVSCHTLDEVRRARDDRASTILFAPVFSKDVEGAQVVAGVGLARLHEACQQAGAVPVLALGGVTEGNMQACMQAGAAGIAGIRLFFPEA
jgi:thiamine-phosphate pyrophosphorylase